MRASEAVVMFLFATPFPAFRYCMNTHSCPPAQPGKCSTGTYTVTHDEVCTPAAADCTFSNSQGLCHYRQGCTDPGMANWTAVNGEAKAQPSHDGACGQDCCFSVLESPWLEIDHTSCLTFNYSQRNLAGLAVFLENLGTGVDSALYTTDDTDIRSVERKDISPGVKKVIFRAHSEAGAPPGDAYISINKVSVAPGLCTLSDCDFGDSHNHHFCGWARQGWRTTSNSSIFGSTSGYFVTATFSNEEGQTSTVTTPLVAPTSTRPNRPDCLRFFYGIKGSLDTGRLTVSVQLLSNDTTFLVWSDDVLAVSWRLGVCRIQALAPYRIIFTAEKSGSGTVEIVLDTIRFSRAVRNEHCQSTPTTVQDTIIQPTDDGQTETLCTPVSTSTAASQSVATHHVVPTAGDTTATTQLSSSSTGQDQISQRSAKVNNTDDDDGANVVLIGGIVAAVIVVIILVVIVIVIVFIRRRSERSDDGSTREINPAENHGETMNDQLRGMENITSDINLYDLPEDGAPGETGTVTSRAPVDYYNHTPTTRPPQATTPAPDDVDNGGNYSRISDAYNVAPGDVENQASEDTTEVHHYDTIGTVPSADRSRSGAVLGTVETHEYKALEFGVASRVKTEEEEVEEAAGQHN